MKEGWKNSKTNSYQDTIKLGENLSKFLEGGDILKINGGLGSGKTTFVKGIAKGLGYNGLVTSPTFTLINEYLTSPKIIHIDCYREKNIERWNLLGITDYFTDYHIIIIEWPSILNKLLPNEYVHEIQIDHISENKRKITLIL